MREPQRFPQQSLSLQDMTSEPHKGRRGTRLRLRPCGASGPLARGLQRRAVAGCGRPQRGRRKLSGDGIASTTPSESQQQPAEAPAV